MLIEGATLADGRDCDVRVRDGTIRAVEPAGTLDATAGERHVDATGRHLLPGVVDPHVHFRQPGAAHKENWTTGTRAAAAGGVTTVGDQPNTQPPTTTGAAFDEKLAYASDALVDYGIAGGVTPDWEPASLFDRPLFALGEVFLADSTGNMGIDVDQFRTAASRAAAAGVVCTVHAEDADRFQPDALPTDGVTGRAADAAQWSRYRPAEAEIAAVETALSTAADTGVSVHIAHTSTPEAVDRVVAARDPSDVHTSPGVNGSPAGDDVPDANDTHDTEPDADDETRTVTCEVTPHHLFLSRADATRLGTYGRMNPPLRSDRRREAMVDALCAGRIDVVATDHAPHTTTEKERPLRDAPSGVPGVETSLPLLLAAVREHRLSVERVRDVTARNPARIFGLPQKGRIAPGFDADLTLVDLDRTREIRPETLHSNCGWTPFTGHEGVFPELTLLRGRVVYDPESELIDGPFGDPVGRNVRR